MASTFLSNGTTARLLVTARSTSGAAATRTRSSSTASTFNRAGLHNGSVSKATENITIGQSTYQAYPCQSRAMSSTPFLEKGRAEWFKKPEVAAFAALLFGAVATATATTSSWSVSPSSKTATMTENEAFGTAAAPLLEGIRKHKPHVQVTRKVKIPKEVTELSSDSKSKKSKVLWNEGSLLSTKERWGPSVRPATVSIKDALPPYDVSIRALRGGRLRMEDEYFVAEGGRFVGVFDGHGGNGVSSLLRERLYKKVNKFVKELHQKESSVYDDDDDDDDEDDDNASSRPSISTYAKALQLAFAEVDKEAMVDESLDDQGSTAVCVALHESDSGEKTILSANVGDSRAILSRRQKALDLTRDHKPNEEKERARILAMGEEIEWDPYAHVYRVRNLSLSRAIGDKFAKPAISGEAEIKRFPMSRDGDEFILLASDGLWDVMTSQEVVSFVHKRLDASANASVIDKKQLIAERRKKMSRYVAYEALLRGSGDNICVIIVWLQDL